MDLSQLIDATLKSWQEFALWLAGFFCVFSLLALICPCNPKQPILRRDALTDILFGLIVPVFTRFVIIFYLAIGLYILSLGNPPQNMDSYLQNGYGTLADLPIWLQAAIIFIVSDIMLYWTHRWFHSRKMWKYHAIHHSPTHVDWLTTFRFHPLNTWLSFTLVDSCMLLAGFSPVALSLMAGFNMIYSAMVHANLNWTFGPFRYVFSSPVFHRWHHTSQQEGRDKNFAPTFPLLDIIFGTFYMPETQLPEKYGVPDSDIPTSFIGQMAWPFKQK